MAELGSLPLSATWTTSAPNDDLWSGRLVIVVDASVLANALADDEENGDIARRELRAADEVTAPDLVDVETVSVLRKRWLHHTLTAQRFAAAIAHLQQLPVRARPDSAVDATRLRIAGQRQRLRRLLRRIGRERELRTRDRG